jgi:hypothetical protein
VKLASWIFVMPFLFVYTPLLLNGSLLDIVATVVACIAGIVAWAGFFEGYVFRRTTPAERILLALAAVFLMLPIDHLFVFLTPYEGEYHLETFAIGFTILAVALLMQRPRAPIGASDSSGSRAPAR